MPNGKIKWNQSRPPDAKELNIPNAELFVLQMSRLFGAFPCELSDKHLERLEGAAATWTDVSANPFDALIRGIRRWGNISIWMDHATSADEVREVLETEAEKRNMA
jgi:hypothetical protein